MAERLAATAPRDLRWGLAGRDRGRLDRVRAHLGVDVPVLVADAHDRADMRRLAGRTRAVVTTVGPFIEHGDAVVAACAETGTDYLDATGEPEFVDRTWLRHHRTAQRTGARLVHACGFDSVPEDLGTLHAVQLLPAGVPVVMSGYVSASGALSSGTVRSAVTAMSRARQARAVHRERRAQEGLPDGRRVRSSAGRAGFDRDVGAWVLPLTTLDPLVVGTSARALARFGPDFTYRHHAVAPSAGAALGVASGVAGAYVLAQLPATRQMLLRLGRSHGGPDLGERTVGWFRVRFVAAGGGRRVVTEVSGGDPGYGATSVMLAEAALCLLRDEVPDIAGQVTTAMAMGDALRVRLDRAGIRFAVLEST